MRKGGPVNLVRPLLVDSLAALFHQHHSPDPAQAAGLYPVEVESGCHLVAVHVAAVPSDLMMAGADSPIYKPFHRLAGNVVDFKDDILIRRQGESDNL